MTEQSTLQLVEDVHKEAQKQAANDGLIHIQETGLVLKINSVPIMLLQNVQKRFPVPKIPKVLLEDKDQWVSNPNDPEYLDALTQREADLGLAMLDVMMGLGTEIHVLPPTLASPDTEEWTEDIEFFIGEEVPKKGKGRYLAWLKYYALKNQETFGRIGEAVKQKMGLTEEQVAAAAESFRDSA